MYKSESIFKNRIRDPKAIYLSPMKGRNDAEALQDAIYLVNDKLGEGIVFVEEGEYLLDRTIYIPTGIRVIGWGKRRPVFRLVDNCEALKTPKEGDKGEAAYLLWFVGRKPEAGRPIFDANAGTFYSALWNVNIDMGHGNTNAVAMRAHYAQHSFISRVEIEINDAKAGIFDTGNAMDHVSFRGGDYGIYTTRSSPSWQFTMMDCAFEGQKIAGIKTREAGLTLANCTFRNMPVAVKVYEGFAEKLYAEDCAFDNITDAGLLMDVEMSSYASYHIESSVFRKVPVAVDSYDGKVKLEAPAEIYKVKDFTHGYTMEKLTATAHTALSWKAAPAGRFLIPANSKIRDLPAVESWINASQHGVIADGKTDVTAALQALIDRFEVIYLPMGRYIITNTLELKDNTKLIGLHPIMTQIEVKDNTEAFSFIGGPVPMLVTPKGGDNIVSGIGLNAGGKNARAVCLKWQSGATSFMNDVKFVGGHGSIDPNGQREGAYNASHTADLDESRKWDSMYPSLWVRGGGGVIYDCWSASPYASSGILVEETDVPGAIYMVSVEHHVRNEVRFRRVKNWNVVCLQLEEEICESSYCQPLEIVDCENMKFANFYTFRVIWLVNPWKYACLVWNSRNITFFGYHNFTQVKLTMDNSLYDVNRHLEVRPWELARLTLDGSGKGKRYLPGELASEFEFIDGMATDSKGNVYFADDHRKRIYRWNAAEERAEILLDTPFKPLSLAVDTEDRLLMVTEYMPQRGMMVNGKPERYMPPAGNEGTDYGKWYGFTGNDIRVFSMDPEDPMETMTMLETCKMADVKPLRIWHPANRWRNNNDWLESTIRQTEEGFLALDGKTVIPDTYDLIRANSLVMAEPGKAFFSVDEYYRRTYKFDVDEHGWLKNPVLFAENGEQGIAVGEKVFVADGQILVFDKDGNYEKTIEVALRPAALAVSGGYVYAACRSSLFRFKI